MFEQLGIGGGKVELREFLTAHPAQISAVNRLRLMRQPAAAEELQVDGFLRVGVRDGLDEFEHFNVAAEFLAQLTAKALLEGFARLAFTAGKFPQPAKMRIGVTLRDEEFAGAEDETGGDFNLNSNFQSPISNVRVDACSIGN